jgi:hypothetical protein
MTKRINKTTIKAKPPPTPNPTPSDILNPPFFFKGGTYMGYIFYALIRQMTQLI